MDLKILIISLSLVILHACNSSLPKGTVRVDFINESNQIIKEIKITQKRGEAKIIDIFPDETESYVFKSKGESTFKFDLELESGKKMSRVEYLESGYFITEIIKQDSIITKY